MSEEAQLTPKQSMFVKEYLIDLNATQAALRAGYSEKTAKQIGTENLAKPALQDAIQKEMNTRSEGTKITSDNVLREIAKLAFFDPRKLYDDQGGLKAVTELDDITAAAISGVDVKSIGGDDEKIVQLTKIKFLDKGVNLERLGKHLKLFTDKVEHSGNVGMTDLSEAELDRKLQQLESKLDQSTKD